MPKLNSIELKHKRKILNWAGENWHKLKESSKVRIWCVMYDKSTPSMIKGEGFDSHKHFTIVFPPGVNPDGEPIRNSIPAEEIPS